MKLAKLLLEREVNISKKVPVLLHMEEYEKALEESLKSKNSNLINMVIIKMVKSEKYRENKDELFRLIQKDEVSN